MSKNRDKVVKLRKRFVTRRAHCGCRILRDGKMYLHCSIRMWPRYTFLSTGETTTCNVATQRHRLHVNDEVEIIL